MNRKIWEPFFSPADGTGGGMPAGGELSSDAQDLADLSEGADDGADTSSSDGDDDADAEDEGGDDGEDSGPEDDGEEEDVAEGEGDEDEEPVEAKGEVDEDAGRPTVRALKAKYPNIFKDFPALKTAFFVAPKFLEIFPDPAAAKEASEKAAEYDILESSLVGKGDPKPVFEALHENNPKALKKVLEALPEVLRDISPQVYADLARPIIEELLYFAKDRGDRTGGQQGKNLSLAAQHIANFVWNNGGEVPDVSRRGAKKEEPSEAEVELKRERESNNRREFGRAAGEVGEQASKMLTPFLEDGLDKHDLRPFERKSIVKELRTEIDQKMQKDEGFMKTLRALWKRAAEDGYSEVSKSRVRKAWLERAKTLAPGIKARLLREATGKASSASGTSNTSGKKRQFNSSGAASTGQKRNGFADPKKINWRKTSDMDILNN